MAEKTFNPSWLSAAILDASSRRTRTDPSIRSSSSRLSPFESSESSHSSVESERTQSEVPSATIVSAASDPAASPQQGHECVAENGERSFDVINVHHKSRKGHKKSREGCFNCKRRKIKCQETQPACGNCTKKNLNCSYPAPKTLKALQGSLLYSTSPIASVNLQGTPTIFSLTDMRLFHHFLMDSYPHLPVGNDSAWLSQIPLIAHHNEYLMHAILGMSASHLELLTGESFGPIAVHHRLLAVQGSNAALSMKTRTGSDGDALLGSCYLLAFQASYMRDGLFEFFTMVRGCSLLSNQLREENLPMAFFLTEKDHFQFMEERLLDLPVISAELVEGAQTSLAAVQPLCVTPSQTEFYQLLDDCVEAIKLSSLRAYFKFISIFQGIIQMDPETFQEFMDSSNIAARILISHFFALQLVVAPIINREWAGRKRSTPVRNHLDQIYQVAKGIPDTYRGYLDWPLAIADAVVDEVMGNKSLVPRVPILRKKDWAGPANGDPGWA
ncbi:hypothetical protein N431DRAFT_357806 [Stipitochalara longipes BDJ]|nr:hypothetical protein N431DRAFT_357806 [Stipitochalara longipes BDJ]